MKNSEHHEKKILTSSLGASHDVNQEISGSENKGTYYDSENSRTSSTTGNKGAREKIKGEQLVHAQIYSGDWFSLCSISVNKDKFEIWVEKTASDDPYIVINGIVMGKSPNMPWLYENRIQWDKNESCIGGEVYLTDFNVPLVILSIKDIKDAYAASEQTYFGEFNPELYYASLGAPLDIPIFTGLVNLGGGGGLPVGSYQYSLRYASELGDVTNWGPLTPTISVGQSHSASSSQYPGIKTYGGNSNASFPTSYGVNLRFRVTNLNDYDYIEIRRISYDSSGGIDIVPNGQIVAKIDIEPGEVSIREFLDPKDFNVDEGILADNEETGQISAIERSKAVRYFDGRLVQMNFETASKDVSADFVDYNGKLIFPICDTMGRMGHNDPVNHTYKKNYPSLEKYSFGINMFDGLGGSGFVVEDPGLNNVQVPSRRDEMSIDSQNHSTGGVVAASVNSSVVKTFEIFDTVGAIAKNDVASFKNILNKGKKSASTVNEFAADAGYGGIVESEEIGYNPYRPVSDTDSDEGHNYRVNPNVYTNTNNAESYNPLGFACNYHTKGFAIGGIENIPSWVKSFSVVRSERAGRVVCQGIGMYSLTKGDFNAFGNSAAATKDKRKLWFDSPDINSGIVSQDFIDDMQVNPQNYSIQLVSPLGFFSEVYSFEENTFVANRDRLIDMVSYARVIKDGGEINPNESGVGVSDYVAYNKYRNSNNPGQGAFNNPEGGNTQFQMSGFNLKTSGRSTYYEIEVPIDLYNHGSTGGNGNNNFEDQEMKDFTEPFYIVNIIRTGAEVSDLNQNSYRSTGHYQKIESLIGEGDGTLNQSFMLVDERWEDCIPALYSSDFNSTGDSFIYLVDAQNNEQICLNVSFKTPTEVSTIISDISTNGFYLSGSVEVRGIFTHHIDANGDVYVDFDTLNTIPSAEQQVIVKYDNSRPIKFFGGDSLIGENVFAPIDMESDGQNSSADEQFDFNIGFPYRKWRLNPRHYVVRKTTGTNRIQNQDKVTLGYLRQLCVMYAAESITSASLSFNGEYPLEFFPMTHYVMRPNRWNDTDFASGVLADIASSNNIFDDYFADYPEEYTIWKYGGFRFDQQFNLDYSVKGPKLFFSKPKVGFKEENAFCTGIAWSLPRAINQQDSPGLKTFPSLNRYFIEDDNGGIKKAWDASSSGKGSNLYAITNSGIVLLLTKKSVLSNLTADELSITATDNFMSGHYWLSQSIGSNGEMWRGCAEGSIKIQADSGKVEIEALFIPNSSSVYLMYENMIKDIADNTYRSRLNESLSQISDDYSEHVTGFLNEVNNEYWLQMPDIETSNIQRCFVYSQDTNYWQGRFHYSFDNYLFSADKIYGLRDQSLFELEKGFQINGLPIPYSLIHVASFEINEEKEWISIEINTGNRGEMKPTEIIFMDEDMTVLSRLNQSLFGPRYLKQHSGWHNQIPRKEAAVSASRERIQYRLILFEIKHDIEEEFKVVSSVVQYKTLK